MHQRSLLSLHTFARKNPFLHPSEFTSSFLLKALAPISTHSLPHLFPHSKTSNSRKPSSGFSRCNHLTSTISYLRCYSGDSGGEFDKIKIIDEINLKFAEAREEIEAAMESKETVYFNEEAECARAAVKEVMDMFNGLLQKLQVQEREALQRSMGLKMEQLKAELQQLDD